MWDIDHTAPSPIHPWISAESFRCLLGSTVLTRRYHFPEYNRFPRIHRGVPFQQTSNQDWPLELSMHSTLAGPRIIRLHRHVTEYSSRLYCCAMSLFCRWHSRTVPFAFSMSSCACSFGTFTGLPGSSTTLPSGNLTHRIRVDSTHMNTPSTLGRWRGRRGLVHVSNICTPPGWIG